jgi:hypothetical protein
MKAMAIDGFSAPPQACTTCLSPSQAKARCWSGFGSAR